MEKRNVTLKVSLAEYYDIMHALISTRDYYDRVAKNEEDFKCNYYAFMSRRFKKVIKLLHMCKGNNKQD